MRLTAGMFLKSTPLLNNTLFKNATIFITENNDDGAVGFVINKRYERQLNELEEFKNSRALPIYDGGPVDKEHLFFVHNRPDIIDEGKKVSDGIYTGGNFLQAIDAVNNDTISKKAIKIFIGYCGWDAGELEEEIKEGSWEIIVGEDVFTEG